jgi:hypothetical protein
MFKMAKLSIDMGYRVRTHLRSVMAYRKLCAVPDRHSTQRAFGINLHIVSNTVQSDQQSTNFTESVREVTMVR